MLALLGVAGMVLLEAAAYTLLTLVLLLIVLWARYRLFISNYVRLPNQYERSVLENLVSPGIRIYILTSSNPSPLKLASLLRRGRVLGIALWPKVIALNPDLVEAAIYSPRTRLLLRYIVAHEEGHLKTFTHSLLLFSTSVGVVAALSSLLQPPLDTIALVVGVAFAALVSTVVSEKLADMVAERKTGLRKKYLLRAISAP